MAITGQLLEHARYAHHRYGTPRGPVEQHLADGVDVLLEIEVQGARQVRQAPGLGAEAHLIFLAPPSTSELVRRLSGRGTDDAAAVAARLAAAEFELSAEPEFDHSIVNETVPATVQQLVELIAGSHGRPSRHDRIENQLHG